MSTGEGRLPRTGQRAGAAGHRTAGRGVGGRGVRVRVRSGTRVVVAPVTEHDGDGGARPWRRCYVFGE
ncbi:hypothetical protein QFZ65_000543 [Arthrobacter sp. B3I9]|nr:hypothetical protein [Arthrobacter sp. B3I9]